MLDPQIGISEGGVANDAAHRKSEATEIFDKKKVENLIVLIIICKSSMQHIVSDD
jgi:hypothetical protein